MGSYFCFSCGKTTDDPEQTNAGMFCPQCGDRMDQKITDQEKGVDGKAPSDAVASAGERKGQKPEFTGSAAEYFRIWIVNTFLTIVTLGIYGAWAKVRNRQYFYKNTAIDGHAFDYTANPLAILKGYLIVGTGFALYSLAGRYRPEYAFIILAIFFLVFPFLAYKSLRFFAHNSAYRNIRFRFSGTLGESYKTYMLYPLLIPFTLGFIVPYWAFRKKRYFYQHMAYGTSAGLFEGRPGPFYKVYLLTALAAIGSFVMIGLAIGGVIASTAKFLSGEPNMPVIIGLGILMYLVMLLAGTFVQQYIYAWTTNYSWGASQLGAVRFISSLRAGRLFWIRISNILAIVLSLGLLIPWAQVRKTRYILDNMTVIAEQGLDDIAVASVPEASAYGDAATDFFDLEIGL